MKFTLHWQVHTVIVSFTTRTFLIAETVSDEADAPESPARPGPGSVIGEYSV